MATAAFEIGDPELREEAANQGELGLHFHGEVLEAELSAYLNRFKDFIYLVDTGEFAGEGEAALPIRQWTQADARFHGIEGEATLRLSENWKLRLFADSVRATLERGGNVPRLAPGRIGSELRWSNAGWRATLGALAYARQDQVAANESETAGYALINASAAYHWDVDDIGWELFVDGRNFGDQTARVHTSFLKDRVVLPGRSVSLGLRALF